MGSIPACAGEPAQHERECALRRVYPRVCGGTNSSRLALPWPWGLSPRVRGNRFLNLLPPSPGGSIPACAGEPKRYQNQDRPNPVYPRVCGGTATRRRPSPQSKGLSPRVRGNPLTLAYPGRWTGSIPACAGEPVASRTKFRLAKVYPRVCGGTLTVTSVPRSGSGLSPRVRGNPESPK